MGGLILAGVSGMGKGLAEVGQMGLKANLEESIEAKRAAANEEMYKRIAEHKYNLENAPLKRAGSLMADAAQQQVPVEAAPVTNLTGTIPGNTAVEDDGTPTPGLTGNIAELKSQIAAIEDPNDRAAAMEQLSKQQAGDKQAAQDDVAGKMRDPKTSEAIATAMKAAIKSGDMQAYNALKALAADKYMKVGPGDTLLDTSNGAVAFQNTAYTDKALIQAEARLAAMEANNASREAIQGMKNEISEMRGGNLSPVQQASNLSIDKARELVSAMSPEEIKKKTAKFTNTGRENPDFDPSLANRVRIAGKRKVGIDDYFDSMSPPEVDHDTPAIRFAADPMMKGYKLGQSTPQGQEVLDPSGKLVGHYQ